MNHGPVLGCGISRVDRVAHEHDDLEIGHGLELVQLIPALNLVVRYEQSVQLLQRLQIVKLIDLIVVEPELLKCAGHTVQILYLPQTVSPQRQNLQVCQLGHRYKSLDLVRRNAQLLTQLKLVDRLVQTIDRIGKLAFQVDLNGLIGDQAVLLFPHANGFTS